MFRQIFMVSEEDIVKKVSAFILLFFISSIFLSNTAHAHPYSAAFTTLYLVNENVQIVYSIDVESVEESIHDLHHEDDHDHGSESFKRTILEVQDQIDEWMQQNLHIYIDGEKASLEMLDLKLNMIEKTKVVTAVYQLPNVENGQSFKLVDEFYSQTKDGNYVNFLTVQQPEQSTKVALQGESREWMAIVEGLVEGTESVYESEVELAPGVEKTDFWSFFKLGMHHILTGYDHLLFLLALIIRPQRVRDLVAIITAFTVGHSITIALGTLEIISLPSQLVEIVIALSICYVAIENIFKKEIKYRWLITVLFGLIHGLGFSTLIRESLSGDSSIIVELLAFNLGIEVMQLALALIVIPVMLFAYKKLDSKKIVVPVSLAVSLMGAIWTVQRFFE